MPEYPGVGRPRAYCDPCRPGWFPPLKEVNRARSGRARSTDPDTSHAAAALDHTAVERRILDAFDLMAWLTDDELADMLPDAHPPTVKAARSRLSKTTPPTLVDTGTRRPSNRGRLMIVWSLKS